MSVHQYKLRDNTDKVINNRNEKHRFPLNETTPVGTLAKKQGTISSFLAPLTQDTFKQVVNEVQDKLKVVNQTLSMLDSQGFEAILQEMLHSITLKTGELLGADRTTIFLLDEEKQELWSIVAEGDGNSSLEIRIPANKGIAGEVATFKKVINIPYDFYDDPRSVFAKKQEKKTGYRTYTMLALPLLNEEGKLVAVVQLLNKLLPNHQRDAALSKRIDLQGFTSSDEQLFQEFAPSIGLILESSRSFYIATQKQRAAAALMKAVKSLSQSNLDLEDTLKRVMDEAKELMNADRSTLWLIDRDRQELWTKITQDDGSTKELRIPIGIGFAGQVAVSGEILNIPFDLYEHPGSDTARKMDPQNGYRTCSLLCMPVFNADRELIGVTQLVNKKKSGDFPPYNPENWPEPPECFQASFDRDDEQFMEAFNIQAGVALQNAQLFATVKQQEQMQRDILRSLSNGVISTNQCGEIVAANESAKQLLGLGVEEVIEGKLITDIINIKEGDFSTWCTDALNSAQAKYSQQYYPDRTLISNAEEEHSINLSINTIADVNDRQEIRGALVVIDDISDEKRLKSTMYRYMTQELAEELLKLDDAKLGGDRKEVSILFSDIRGYTTLTENLEAEEVVSMLNEYFESMVEAVFKYKGTLDKYIGDAIMAVYGSPLPLEEHAWMAVQTSLEMRNRLYEFNQRRRAANKPIINIGIGINSDIVISGNIGSSKRMEFTAIGDGVNLGSRLESVSKQYGCDIILSDNTYKPCQEQIWARELDYIRVKGRNEPVAIYELIGLRNEPIDSKKIEKIEHYHQGRKYYVNRQFNLAKKEFENVLQIDRNDLAAKMHKERCEYWLGSAPTDIDNKWDDGVWTFKDK
ncbi:adenylate/guanylate cyclase domain-containing protein [Mastigocoleus sp. MO_188.B34]|uniref:GAF domain-containing protein n=1 Tax=Mastigocoleus sp. MO_188.B34 TaxID=3036635 RepID=UPI0026277C33|nr:adenylate/guanylate cyclase domain-containing protein [Mastigocoleus sp. MO_188.B34]MDJ0697567.1 GAF domain-containing protein [Mastigocoleus sp. MO_188.B34]